MGKGYELRKEKKIQRKPSKWNDKGKRGILEERRAPNPGWGGGQESFHGDALGKRNVYTLLKETEMLSAGQRKIQLKRI